jgi:L-alanine-DL-glutamate epimerase-like enolase superfamily enzyme
MELVWQPFTLELERPFTIAHGQSDTRSNVLVRLEEGIGEAAGVPYLGETAAGIAAYLARVDVRDLDDPARLDEVLARLPAGSAAARAACDMALHDLWGKRLGQPLQRLLGLNPARIQPTSFTIAMAAPELMAEQARRLALPILKLKLGDDQDEARVLALRQACGSRLRVDANAGWSREKAARLLPRLAELGVELVEQPLPAGDVEGLAALARIRPRPPIFADESIKTMADIVAHAGKVDGVVIKLAKCGGLREARRQIDVAHALGLQVMIGCMIESSLAVTAAAQLAPLAEHVDLDGPLLIRNDPYIGLSYEGARITLSSSPGLGVTARAATSVG